MSFWSELCAETRNKREGGSEHGKTGLQRR